VEVSDGLKFHVSSYWERKRVGAEPFGGRAFWLENHVSVLRLCFLCLYFKDSKVDDEGGWRSRLEIQS
jgi:hypothetical protein